MTTGIWEFIKDLSKNQPLWANLASLAAVIGALYGFLELIGKGVKRLFHLFTGKKLHRLLKPYFTREDIRRAIGNYIPTQCQNVDPAAAAEPGRVHAFAVRQKLIPFFMKTVFREKKEEKYYLVLADSGMGKTTFMINLFLKYMKKRFKEYQMVLVPLGHPNADKKIETVEDKPCTILLLDAFDEDARAAKDYKTRMQELIDKTMDFQTVIITSRTQFFPSDPEIPEETGLYKFGGKKGEHRFYRIYVSPFNQNEINRYLKRKFPVYLWFKRRKARSIVAKSPDLMVRPMLLANIQGLLQSKKTYRHTCEIYEEMVNRWIQRERVKDKVELRKFSEVIARDIYENQQARSGLFIDCNEIVPFAQKYNIDLEEIVMRSRSLLNRNADGKYKFAHKSILEYLLSLELIRDTEFFYSFNFSNMEQTRRFCYEQIVVPFFSRPLKGEFRLLVKEGVGLTDKTTKIKNIKELDLKELGNIDYFNLRSNQIMDIRPLQELKNIKTLNLSNNQITDLSSLRELKNIDNLNLSGNQITDLSSLRELNSINELNLGDNQITDIYPLRELRNIKALSLSINQITNLSPLRELRNIETLSLSFNQITDLSPLQELENIWSLGLSGNQITDLIPLRELKKIKTLDLSNNQITDLSPLQELENIEILLLSYNRVTDFRSLQELKNIETLVLSNNQITDLSPLLELTGLRYLDLRNNPAKDEETITELRKRLSENLKI